MKEPEKYLPMNRAELIARCEAQEAVLRSLLPYAIKSNMSGVHVVVHEAKELLK